MPQLRHTAQHAGPQYLPSRSTIALMALRPRAMDCLVSPDPESQTASLVRRLAEIMAMSTGELRAEFQRLSGRTTGSWNREWLRRKVSWLTQVKERQKSDAVGSLTLVAEVRDQPRSPRLDAPIQVLPGQGVRDPRLPGPGAQIVKTYRGLKLVVDVVEGAFLWNGRPYRSLTAIAKDVTGQPFINGKLFFGITKRRRGKGRNERST